MTRKEKIRLVRILVFALLLSGGVVFLSYFGPKIKKEKPSQVIEDVQEKIKENEFGKTVLKILGAETEEEADDKEKQQEKKEEKQSIVENFKEKIEKAIIEKSSEKVIDILETLPPEEFENLRKEFCPRFCQPD